MDILDILIAKKQSSDAQADAAVRKAQEAVQKANQVTAKIDAAQELLATAETAISELNAAKEDLGNIDTTIENKVRAVNDEEYMPDINTQLNDLDGRIDTLEVDFNTLSDSIPEPTTLYTTTGQHTDGTMTQKAITDALKAIPQGGGDGTSQTFPPEAIGQLITVGEDSTAEPSTVAEADMVELLIKSSSYNNPDAVGIEIDYENRTVKRTQAAAAVTTSTDIPTFFNNFKMYGGMKRCVVADNGEIVAFEGDSNYIEDGSLGQVMVYIPAFYYKRTPIKVIGQTIQSESLILSHKSFPGAKLHPFFGNNKAYGLYSAYEGSIYYPSTNTYDLNDGSTSVFNGKLSSIANAKPVSGANKSFNSANALQVGSNRGTLWNITSSTAESAIQMLMIVEYGTLNMQAAIGSGVTALSIIANAKTAAITGSTSSLGSTTGVAPSTTIISSDTRTNYTTDGYCSISYRGIENPWGNLWRVLMDMSIVNNRINVTPSAEVDEEIDCLPAASGFASNFTALKPALDYLFIPDTINNGTNTAPVGDYVWVKTDTPTVEKAVALGGHSANGERAGIFAYGFDNPADFYSSYLSARLMAKPTEDATLYDNNITKWSQAMTKAYGTINWL